MRTQIRKWGNSLAVRIPRSFAAETGMEEDGLVDLTLQDGRLVLTPVRRATLSLEQLLEAVTEENVHAEWWIGSPIGKEIW